MISIELAYNLIPQAIVAALFMNIYIVGLNQLSDIEIDKVSCMFHPNIFVSGELEEVLSCFFLSNVLIL